MTDVETRLRFALDVLADAEPVATPPIDHVLTRAPRPVKPHRSRTVVAAVAVGTLALVGTAVGAAGLLPRGVDRSFRRISDWGAFCQVDVSSARLLASVPIPDGRSVEWWLADGAHARGEDVRVVNANGTSRDWSQACTNLKFPLARTSEGSVNIGAQAAVSVFWGQAPPGAIKLRAVYSDGSTVDVPLQQERCFMGLASTTGGTPHRLIRTEAIGSNGQILDSIPAPS